MNINLESENINLLKQVASNLGIDDIKQGSYINTVLRGLLSLNERTLESIETKIDNINIDTADEETLEQYGVKRNLPRFKNNELSILAKEKGITLRVDLFDYEADKDLKLFVSGDIVFTDNYRVTFLEDVWFNSSLKEVYISCNISVIEDLVAMRYMENGTSLSIRIPNHYRSVIKDLSLNLKRDAYLSNFKESLEVYRARLKHSITSENMSNKSGISLLMNRIPYVSQYYIDESITPFKIYILNTDMYFDKEVDKELEEQSIPFAEGALDRYRGYSCNFEFELAKRISYGIEININLDYETEMFSFLNQSLIEDHRLGDYYTISKSNLDRFLEGYTLEKDFTYKMYYHYNGVQILAPDPNYIEFKPNEFPFLESLTVNGESLSVYS